ISGLFRSRASSRRSLISSLLFSLRCQPRPGWCISKCRQAGQLTYTSSSQFVLSRGAPIPQPTASAQSMNPARDVGSAGPETSLRRPLVAIAGSTWNINLTECISTLCSYAAFCPRFSSQRSTAAYSNLTSLPPRWRQGAPSKVHRLIELFVTLSFLASSRAVNNSISFSTFNPPTLFLTLNAGFKNLLSLQKEN